MQSSRLSRVAAGKIGLALLCAGLSSIAQGQAPTLASISSASFSGLAVQDGLATIFGTNMSDKVHAATTLPLPMQLGPTSLQMCPAPGGVAFNCQPVPLIYVSPTQINFYVPRMAGLTAGMLGSFEVEAILTVGGQTAQAYTYLAPENPSIFPIGYDCNYDPLWADPSACGISASSMSAEQVKRGAITDLNGNVLTSLNPARVGQYYVIYLTGLGVDQSGNVPLIPEADMSVALTLNKRPHDPLDTPFTISVTPEYAGESSFQGLQQVNFMVPAEAFVNEKLSCGLEYQFDLAFGLSAQESTQGYFSDNHGFSLPLLIKKGELPCTP